MDPAKALRSQFRAEAAALSRRDGLARALAALVLHIGSAVAVALLAERIPGGLAHAAVLPPTWLVIGSRFRALGNLMHEASHRALVRGRRANLALGHLLSLFDFTDFVDYLEEHYSHHRYIGDPERDRDYAARRALFTRLEGAGRGLVWRPLTLFHLPYYIRPVLWSRRDTWAVAAVRQGFHLTLILCGLAIGWRPMLLYYFIPYLTTYQIFRFWSDAADHAGLMAGATEFDRARNHIFRFAPLNWLVFPRNDQYHLVHHLFPNLTTRGLPHMHRVLLRSPTYAARAHGVGAAP